ncbi:MAG: prenyltransferase/squalene oxidase repeat-containing protein [Bacteroidota bacterium]
MNPKIILVVILFSCLTLFFAFAPYSEDVPVVMPQDCVFNTVFGVVELDSSFLHAPAPKVQQALDNGLSWLIKAQHPDGGWGAGFHSAQHVRDPHAVPPDPATTAMVSMALLRSGSSLSSGPYASSLEKSTEFILTAIEQTPPDGSKITQLNGTQIQGKLGQNIDLVLSLQYLNNLLEKMDQQHAQYERVYNVVAKGVDIVETVMDTQGRTSGAGWAGVLQSSFATNALEAAESNGIMVDTTKLKQSRAYQRGNYDPVSKSVKTRDGAGVMLYSVSGSARANAKGARKAKEIIAAKKKAGQLEDDAEVSYKTLVQAGVDEKKALEYEAEYNVYESAKMKAQEREVMSGFGNNGGEEFMSFLQTGESLIINKDESWKNWYDQLSANLLNIQNQDGSWNGHHCITSPVFCTATCVLILSVNNDIEELLARGQ